MVCRFGVFELDLKNGELRKNGALIKLQPQPYRVLSLLVSRPGELVTREEIQQQIWGDDTFVDFERGLNYCIKQIRTALDDEAENPRFVETLPKRGYRFIAPVEKLEPSTADPVRRPPSPVEPVPPPRPGPRALWVVVLVIAALAVGTYLLRNRFWPHRPGDKVMLVVLPFDNIGDDPSQEYFSDGLTEEMITRLGQLNPQHLGVIARTTAMKYKDTDETIAQIGKELKVEYVLEGAVRHGGNRVRISAQLIEVKDRTHVWAEPYERELNEVSDALTIQREVAERVAESLGILLLPGRQPAPATVNPEAYQAYLMGRFHWNKREVQESIAYFQQAVDRDPDFALGYAGLADAYGLLGSTPYAVLPPDQAKPKAIAAARRALELDDNLAEAHTALARDKLFYEWDWDGAEEEFRHAIRLNPSYSTAHQWYAEYLWLTRRWDEALDQVQQAMQRDPDAPVVTYFALGRHYYLVGDYPKAVSIFREWVQAEPNFFLGYFDLGLAHIQMGQHEEAIAEFQRAVELSGENPLCVGGLGYAYAAAGRKRDAEQVLQKMLQASQRRYVPAFYLAGLYAALGRKDKTFEWLEKAYQERSDYLVYVAIEPVFEPLRDDPRFQELLRRVHYPGA